MRGSDFIYIIMGCTYGSHAVTVYSISINGKQYYSICSLVLTIWVPFFGNFCHCKDPRHLTIAMVEQDLQVSGRNQN